MPGNERKHIGINLQKGRLGKPDKPLNPSRPDQTSKTRWSIAIAVTLALHGGIVAYTKITTADIEKAVQTISFLIQSTAQKINSTWAAFTQSREQYDAKREQLTKWRKALKEDPALPGFDYGDFFSKLPWLEGQLSEEELEDDQQKMESVTNHYKELHKKQPKEALSITKKMIEERFGRYTEWSAQLHGLLGGEGNCTARTQMMISLIQGVFGGTIPMKARVSRQKLEDGREQMHSDLLIKIGDKWHIAAPELPETKIEDIEGVALFETSDFVKTFVKDQEQKPKPNIVKEQEEPNKNELDVPPTNALVDLTQNVDPKKLKTHEQKPPKKPAETGPIEITMIPANSAAAINATSSKPEANEKPQKHRLTSQEVVDTALTGEITITPDIETLEPLRGVPLNRILIHNPAETSQPEKYPSFEPLAQTPPKEILIGQSPSYNVQGQLQLKNTQVPDLSPLHGKTVISDLAIAIDDANSLQKWETILENFEILDASISIVSYRNHKANLDPLKKTRIKRYLRLRIAAREGTVDLAGIGDMTETPRYFEMDLFAADQKFTNLQALGKIHFRWFNTTSDTLNNGILDGAVIQTDTVELRFRGGENRNQRHLAESFITQNVVIVDPESSSSSTEMLEAVRGMPHLDYMGIEMESHKESKYREKYGHMSYHEIYTGEKPNLDLSPLEEVSIKELLVCAGYQLPQTIPAGIARIMVPVETANPEEVEKWRKHLRTMPNMRDRVPPPPPPPSPPPSQPQPQQGIDVPETLQRWLQIPNLH